MEKIIPVMVKTRLPVEKAFVTDFWISTLDFNFGVFHVSIFFYELWMLFITVRFWEKQNLFIAERDTVFPWEVCFFYRTTVGSVRHPSGATRIFSREGRSHKINHFYLNGRESTTKMFFLWLSKNMLKFYISSLGSFLHILKYRLNQCVAYD